MSDQSIIKINNTSYNIEEDWLGVAKKYFNMDDNSLNLLKSGLFGYTNEIASNEIKNNTYHRNVLYDEHFINTASMPQSIYNFAKLYNYSVDTATPSHMRINFSVRKSDLINSRFKNELTEKGKISSNGKRTFEITLNNEFVFSIKNFKFLLPYPVQILLKETNKAGDYAITARYKMNDANFPFFDKQTPYIKVWTDSFNGDKYLFFGLDLFQLSKNTQQFSVMSEDISDNLFYTFEYTEQLAYFNVYYTYKGERTLLKQYFNNTFNPPDDEKFCYYTFLDDNKLQISFSSLPNNFRPRFNSSLDIEVFTTAGKGGNFSYNGNVLFNFNNNDFEKMPVYVNALTDASGGQDKPDITTVKNKTIQELLVRKNLIIDTDLDLFFNNINTMNNVNNSKITFVKKRNDVINRLYSCFLLLRDGEKKVLPTNTCPTISVSLEEYLMKNSFCIPDNTVVIYDYTNNSYKFDFDFESKVTSNNGNIPIEYSDNNRYLIYSLPYLIKIEESPILKALYYKTNVTQDAVLSYKNVNNRIIENFIINELNLNKSALSSDTYKLNLSLNTTVSSINIDTLIKIRCILKNKEGKTYGYIDFKRKSLDGYEYEAILATNNKISNNQINIYNSIYDVNGSHLPSDIITNCMMDEFITVEVGVLYKDNDTKEKYGDFIKMKDIDDYATAVVFETIVPLRLFSNLSNIMDSNVKPIISGPKTTMDIKNIPLIEYKYFKKRYFDVYKILDIYNDLLLDNIQRLESNTNIDIKLYNSYGPSKFYYTSKKITGDVVKYNYIRRTDVPLDFVIHLNAILTDREDLSIKQFISEFIESCNDDNLVPISNLIRLLEQNFDIIRYIEFGGIAGDKSQKIESTFESISELTKQEIIDYVPEYINLRKELGDIKSTDSSGNVYLLGTSYNYNINITYL